MRYRIMFLTGIFAITVPLMYGQVDPATLHIGPGVGTTCATGCAGEPNVLNGSSAVDIYQNSSGANTIPGGSLLFVVAVPNGGSLPSGTITETDYNSSGVKTDTGTATLQTTTGTVTSSNGNNVYTALGLTGADASGNFSNLTCAAGTNCANGSNGSLVPSIDKNATSFTVYEYLITGSNLVANGYAQLSFGSGIPVGDYFFGYGCQGTSTSFSTNCTNNPNPYDTAFTEAGVQDAPRTPEPTAIVLLGSSMIGIGAIVRRRRRSTLA